ncbi:MAG: PAS domain S-box protein, partial [Nitrospirae bacterium]|nr:PAS domain S-box protein [Nitrospirota bacterium]
LGLCRVTHGLEASDIADELVVGAFERSTFREDYLRTNSERAKLQWFAKYEQIGKLLTAASEKFQDTEDRKIIETLIEEHKSTEKLFTSIVENRNKRGLPADSAALSQELEDRLRTQLIMRVYDKVLNFRKLHESAQRSLFSALMFAGAGIFAAFAIIVATTLINSWTMGRMITGRILRLCDGASVIGKGNLDYRGDDEFAELSDSFNAMTVQLSGTNSSLRNEIEDRKRAEEVLRQSEERFRSYFELGLIGMAITSPDKGIIEVNEKLCEIFGYKKNDLLQMTWAELTHADDLAADISQFNKVLAGEIDGYTIDKRFVRKNGDIIDTTIAVTCVRTADGSVDFFLALLQDITERKQAEEALRKATEFDEAALKSLGEGLYTIDDKGLVSSMNPAAEELFGWTFEELRGKKMHDITHHHYRDGRLFPSSECAGFQVLTTGVPLKNHEDVFIHKNGTFFDVIYSIAPLRDNAGKINGLVVVFSDISEPKRAEVALRKAHDELELRVQERTKELRELNETLEQRVAERTSELKTANASLHDFSRASLNLMDDALAARRQAEEVTAELAVVNKELEMYSVTVSHDLKAPLRSIMGFTRAITEDYADKLDKTGKDYFRRITSAGQKMSQLIDALLSMARMTRGELMERTANLSDMAEVAAYELGKKYPERRVESVIAKGVKAHGDIDMLKVVIDNLMDNAWKFTVGHEQAKIEFGVYPNKPPLPLLNQGLTNHPGLRPPLLNQGGEQAVYFVRDDGAGFNMEFAGKLFEPFKRLHSDSEFPGLGIGLAIVHKIIIKHGGKIWAESEVEKGATFYFTLG